MLEYKCPCCGGAINFDSKLQKMKCPYCDTEFDMETLKSYDEDLKKNTQDNMNWDNSNEQTFTDEETEGMSVYVCNSCGGEIVADENTGATSCPYCGNPVVLKGRFSGDLKPDYVIPFRLTKEDAIKALSKHVNKKLVPKIFKDKNHIDQIRGMYVPFWLFDADTEAHIQYKGTKVRHWSDSDYDYTETKYYLVGRGGNVGFTNVPVDGSSQMPDDLMESIEPFNFDEAVDFQTAYLAGYLADKYDVCISSGSACHKGELSHVLSAYGYSADRINSALRISFCESNTKEDVDALVMGIKNGLKELVKFK